MITKYDGTEDVHPVGEHDVDVELIELGTMEMVTEKDVTQCVILRYTGVQPDGQTGTISTVFSEAAMFVSLLSLIAEAKDIINEIFPEIEFKRRLSTEEGAPDV